MAFPIGDHVLLLLIFTSVLLNGQGIEGDPTLDKNVDAIFNAVVSRYCQAGSNASANEADIKMMIRGVLMTQKESCQPSPDTGPAVTEGPCVDVNTVNLSAWWRKDNLGSAIKPIFGILYACDRSLQNGTRWFRFTGDAGDQISNSCRPSLSCGGHGGFWSDAEMPTEVGEVRKVPIYGSWLGNCKRYNWPETNAMTVQRCSNKPGDFVYKVNGTQSCHWTFCGMNA